MSDQSQRRPTRPSDILEPVLADKHSKQGTWTDYLILFLRIMAGVSLIKGLYHWSQVLGIGAGADAGFEAHTIAWQTSTVFFAVLDLVAAVGLWLAAAWGAERSSFAQTFRRVSRLRRCLRAHGMKWGASTSW